MGVSSHEIDFSRCLFTLARAVRIRLPLLLAARSLSPVAVLQLGYDALAKFKICTK